MNLTNLTKILTLKLNIAYTANTWDLKCDLPSEGL